MRPVTRESSRLPPLCCRPLRRRPLLRGPQRRGPQRRGPLRRGPQRRRAILSAGVLILGAWLASPGMGDTLLVANKSEATVSLLDLASGKVVATLPTGNGPHEVAVSPDGSRALVSNYGDRGKPGSSLTLLDVAAARVLATLDLEPYTRPHGVVWIGERRAVVTAEDQKKLLVVDVEKGAVEKGAVEAAIDTAREVSHMVALSGERAFVTNIGSGSVTVLDVGKRSVVADVETGDGAEGVAAVASRGQVWVTNRAADTLSVLDGESLEILATIESAGFPIRAVPTPAGDRVLVTHARAGDLGVYSTEAPFAGRRIALEVAAGDPEDRLFGDRFGSSSVPIGIVVAGTGDRIWIAHANADIVSEHRIPEAAGGEWTRVRLLEAGREPDGMAWTPVDVERVEESAGSR